MRPASSRGGSPFAEVRVTAVADHATPHTYVEVTFDGSPFEELSIEEGEGGRETGDGAFDAAFRVEAEPAERLDVVLGQEVRAALLACAEEGKIRVGVDRVEIFVPRVVGDGIARLVKRALVVGPDTVRLEGPDGLVAENPLGAFESRRSSYFERFPAAWVIVHRFVRRRRARAQSERR